MNKSPKISGIRTTVKSHITFDESRLETFGINNFDPFTTTEEFIPLSNQGSLKTGPPLRTDFYILVLCLKGESQKNIGPFTIDVKPLTIHLVSPKYISSYRDKTDDLELYMLLFKLEFLTRSFIKEEVILQLLEISPDMTPIYDLSEDAFYQLKALFEQIDREYRERKAYNRQIVRLLLIQSLFEMSRACEKCKISAAKQASRQSKIVMDFKKHVDRYFLEKRSVQEYAQILHISPKYLLEVVKKETGQTALNIIHSRIYLEAQFLLSQSQKSIKEIALGLGFDTSSHFSRFFRQFEGKTPLQYQQQL
ncbi:AraC family transcriptional regulator [Mucilaginibacter sp. SMC90]|uniref:helix-turn-helix domain-containing protein n=1 Tax=Mucilaginibacter sp. SMC90 TaxID=2929803 RepID=UPI001FB361E1|nr:helix-turn-helix domain-containing protein [Mucilaginibacter sp. SMC90]UOE48843.1 AraC family transcriptional regulator [Mucilaginibacter sp. SMC90]